MELKLPGGPNYFVFFALSLSILNFDPRGVLQTSGSKETEVIFTILDFANPWRCAQTRLSRSGYLIRGH
mgnify:CR=1 FL=1